MNYDDESDDEPKSTHMLKGISDRSQSFPNINKIEVCHKIRDINKQLQSEWKGALLSTQIIAKGLHKVFKTFVNDIYQN